MKKEGALPSEVEHRQAKYLNNRLESDHGHLKRLIRPTLGFQSMKTARATISGFEVMRMVKKGQFRFWIESVGGGPRRASSAAYSTSTPDAIAKLDTAQHVHRPSLQRRRATSPMPSAKRFCPCRPPRQTITFDRGSEFPGDDHLNRNYGIDAYFCDPQAPSATSWPRSLRESDRGSPDPRWQQGGIENTNGRLRRFLPSELAPAAITSAALRDIETRTNVTPRKCLGFMTPQEAFVARAG